MRKNIEGMQWLATHLKPLANTPYEKFLFVSAHDVKTRVRQRIKKD